MLVTWRYRARNSQIQKFDPRAWFIFYACFLASALFFWDVRFLVFFLVIALVVVFSSRVTWHEIAPRLDVYQRLYHFLHHDHFSDWPGRG